MEAYYPLPPSSEIIGVVPWNSLEDMVYENTVLSEWTTEGATASIKKSIKASLTRVLKQSELKGKRSLEIPWVVVNDSEADIVLVFRHDYWRCCDNKKTGRTLHDNRKGRQEDIIAMKETYPDSFIEAAYIFSERLEVLPALKVLDKAHYKATGKVVLLKRPPISKKEFGCYGNGVNSDRRTVDINSSSNPFGPKGMWEGKYPGEQI